MLVKDADGAHSHANLGPVEWAGCCLCDTAGMMASDYPVFESVCLHLV